MEIVPFLFVLVLVAAVLMYQNHSRRVLGTAFLALARKYGGKANPGSLWQFPSAQFRAGTLSVKLDVTSTGGKHRVHFTELRAHGLDPTLRYQVYPERFWNAIGRALGFQDIEIGVPDFDRRYVVSGNSPDRIRKWLDEDSRDCIDELRALLNTDDVFVQVQAGSLYVKKRGLFRDVPSLDRFTSLALSLVDAQRHADDAGIQFLVASPGREVQHETACQICGERIDTSTTEVVFCRSCHTPHHADCWDYAGRCSTYGCGQREFSPHA